ERMLSASAENAEDDVAFRRLVEVKNQAEPVLRAAEKKLPDAFRLLPETEAHEIETRIEGLRRAFQDGDPSRIQEAKSQLDRATVRLAELIVKETIDQSRENRS